MDRWRDRPTFRFDYSLQVASQGFESLRAEQLPELPLGFLGCVDRRLGCSLGSCGPIDPLGASVLGIRAALHVTKSLELIHELSCRLGRHPCTLGEIGQPLAVLEVELFHYRAV